MKQYCVGMVSFRQEYIKPLYTGELYEYREARARCDKLRETQKETLISLAFDDYVVYNCGTS